MRPSPQTAAPDSSRQVLEQPSPSTLLPSSQVSPPLIRWSPQIGTHRLPGTRQCHPGSTVVQSAAHPSPDAALPSSQASTPLRTPSPQTASRTSQKAFAVEKGRGFCSSLQSAEQPSSDARFPSSHSSAPRSKPSPHTAGGS